MRPILIALLCWVPLTAQFENLVTNDDGSVLYFSSNLRMRGSGQVAHRKLFVLDAGGLRLYMQRSLEQTRSPDATWPVSNYHSLEGIATDGSGSRVGVIARRDCYGGSGCLPTPKFRTELQGRDYRGRMSLSRNGRYALLWGDGSMVGANSFVDLETGQSATWIAYTSWTARYGRRQVSSNGTAVFVQDRVMRVFRLDGDRTIDLPAYGFDPAIDDEARTAVYQSEDGLYAVDLATGGIRKLADGPPTVRMQPCISNDGRTVLFASQAAGQQQVFAINPDEDAPRRLTNESSGIREIVLSGDGRIAYAVTGSGRVLRITADSGITDEVIGQTVSLQPVSSSIAPYPVPGSAFTIRGRGLARTGSSASPPLPWAWNGLELLLDGQPVPLQTVEPERVVFQIPWETTPGMHRLEVRTDANPFFEVEPMDLDIRYAVFAQFEALPDEHGRSLSGLPYVLAAHHDFSGLVAPANPAHPGEVVHVYMTGLGPVDPPVPTGEPAPPDPPARITSPLACVFAPPDITTPERPAEILFAGLAPGFTGYYQVTIRIPEDVRSLYGGALLSCRPSGPGTGIGGSLPMADRLQ